MNSGSTNYKYRSTSNIIQYKKNLVMQCLQAKHLLVGCLLNLNYTKISLWIYIFMSSWVKN